ncbi:MAG TPA: DUF1566 domain-containing protein [bacterium]|nr:DUF1566 domain-containing protein [bacterium]
MRNILILLAVLVVAVTLGAEEKRYKVAVMEFDDQTKKLSKSMLETAAEYLRGELVASNQFIVISKDRQKKALIKEEKKESWKECYDQQCRIQLGQALSADTILTGTISKFSRSYILTLELIDLAKEATIKGAKVEFDSTEEGLKVAIGNVVAQITGSVPKDENACAFAKEKDELGVWQDYLKEYPKGSCILEAKTKIKELKKKEGGEKATQLIPEKKEKQQNTTEGAENKKTETDKKKLGQREIRRWKVQGEIVRDMQTSLMWQRGSGGTKKYDDAIRYCEKLSLGGYHDWRLPSISELKTLIVGCQSGTYACGVNDDCLSNSPCYSDACFCLAGKGPGEGGHYWQKGVWLRQESDSWFLSSSIISGDSAWSVEFLTGSLLFSLRNQSTVFSVRCVRGGQ